LAGLAWNVQQVSLTVPNHPWYFERGASDDEYPGMVAKIMGTYIAK